MSHMHTASRMIVPIHLSATPFYKRPPPGCSPRPPAAKAPHVMFTASLAASRAASFAAASPMPARLAALNSLWYARLKMHFLVSFKAAVSAFEPLDIFTLALVFDVAGASLRFDAEGVAGGGGAAGVVCGVDAARDAQS